MKKNVKTLKAAVIISFVTTLFLIAGVVLQFVNTRQFDASGCGILACNTAILSSCLIAYRESMKAEQNK